MRVREKYWHHAAFLLLSVLTVFIFCMLLFNRKQHEYKSEEYLMDTLVSIKVYGNDEDLLRTAVMDAFAEMHRIADLTDRFPPPGTAAGNISDVCRINNLAGVSAVRVDKDVFKMLRLAEKYNKFTDGAFDVTVGPVIDLWGFCGSSPRVPASSDLRKTLAFVDAGRLKLNGKTMSAFLEKKGMSLDLGAVAKGYAAEQAVQILKKHGISKALIDAGGNIRVLGSNQDGKPWRIGIKNPRSSGGILAVLSLEDSAAVTSGDYYRYFEYSGKRYNHIIDPRTGTPAVNNMSVTVIAGSSGMADVLSTSFFVLEPAKAIELAKKQNGVELFIVATDGRIMMTPGLEGRIEMNQGSDVYFDQGR